MDAAPARLSTPFDGPAELGRVSWDVDRAGDDEGRSNAWTLIGAQPTRIIGYELDAATAIGKASDLALATGGVQAVLDAGDGAHWASSVSKQPRLGGGTEVSIDWLTSVLDDAWSATSTEPRMIALVDARGDVIDTAAWKQQHA